MILILSFCGPTMRIYTFELLRPVDNVCSLSLRLQLGLLPGLQAWSVCTQLQGAYFSDTRLASLITAGSATRLATASLVSAQLQGADLTLLGKVTWSAATPWWLMGLFCSLSEEEMQRIEICFYQVFTTQRLVPSIWICQIFTGPDSPEKYILIFKANHFVKVLWSNRGGEELEELCRSWSGGGGWGERGGGGGGGEGHVPLLEEDHHDRPLLPGQRAQWDHKLWRQVGQTTK